MKKGLFILLSSVLLLAGCEHKAVIHIKETNLNLAVTENYGFIVTVSVTPDDDRVFYLYSVYETAELDSIIRSYPGETEAMQDVMDSAVTLYGEYAEMYREYGHEYIADFEDLMLYFSKDTHTFVDLKPETDHTVIAFCVDPIKKVPIGRLHKLPFRTAAVPKDAINMDFDFMIQDTQDNFYYYTKPTYKGKICKDLYITDIVSDSVLYYRFSGRIMDFIDYKYGSLYENVDEYEDLSRDITRKSPTEVHDRYRYGGDNGYTLFAVPFNPKYKESVITLHFEYTPGIHTNYAHD